MGLKGKARQRANKKAKNQIKNMGFLRQKSLRENIRKWADPILTTKCEDINIGENIVDIIKKMKSTLMATRNGVGLAASQVGFTKNIIVIRSNRVTNEMSAYINPVIKSFSEEKEVGVEGCLSYPELYLEVERSVEIQMDYLDEEFKAQSVSFKGSDARIAQHECEHLLGKCVIGEAWKRQQGTIVENNENNSINNSNDATAAQIIETIDNYKFSDASLDPDGINIVR